MLAGFGLAAGSLYLFAKLVSEIFEQEMTGMDMAAYNLLHSMSSPVMDTLMRTFTIIGSGPVLVLLCAGIAFFLYRHFTLSLALFFLGANVGGALLDVLLKNAFQRARPLIDETIGAVGYSLPSGHAMSSLIFYGFLAWLVVRAKKQGPWSKVALCFLCVLMICSIGVSRIYLQAHYATDVLAGYLAGTCWLIACIIAYELTFGRKAKA